MESFGQVPIRLPTHSDEQTFYFNEKGLLQRLDYVIDVAGGAGAHYCYDHASFGGIVYPTLRRVVFRKPSGPIPTAPTGVLLESDDIYVA